MTFEDALLNSGYIYDKFVGSFMKEESNGDLHTYLNVEDDGFEFQVKSRHNKRGYNLYLMLLC